MLRPLQRDSVPQGPGGARAGPGAAFALALLRSPSLATRRKYLQRWHLEILLRRFQVSQRARCLRATWQHWAGAPGAEQLSQSLVSGLGNRPQMSRPHVPASS